MSRAFTDWLLWTAESWIPNQHVCSYYLSFSVLLSWHRILPATWTFFYALPVSELQEVQINFGGQSIQFMSSSESLSLSIFNYDKNISQLLCLNHLGVLMPKSKAVYSIKHSLLQEDLVQHSFYWTAYIPDLVLSSAIRLSSKFHSTSVNLPFSSQKYEQQYHLIGWSSVISLHKCPGQGGFQLPPLPAFVLLNIHIALVREHPTINPLSQSLNWLCIRACPVWHDHALFNTIQAPFCSSWGKVAYHWACLLTKTKMCIPSQGALLYPAAPSKWPQRSENWPSTLRMMFCDCCCIWQISREERSER